MTTEPEATQPDPAPETDPATGLTDPATEPGTEPDPRDELIADLRREIVEKRLKAKRIDDANAGLLAAYLAADGRLIDPDALPLGEHLLDDRGLVDRDRVVDALDDLLADKPWLRIRAMPTMPGLGESNRDPLDGRGLFDLLRGT